MENNLQSNAGRQQNDGTDFWRLADLQVPNGFKQWLKTKQRRGGPAWRKTENLDETLMRMLTPANLAEYFGWLWAETTKNEKTENGTKTSERNKTGNRKQQTAGFYGERGTSRPELGEELLD